MHHHKRSSSPKVSVVTVVRNAEDVIEETIESVLQQSYPAVEYVVVDGESNDATWSTIQEYAECIDTAISEPDKGIYDAMNKAARLATGDWIIYMNAGDTFASPHVLADLAEALASDADVILGGVEQVLVDAYETRRFRQFPGPVEELWKRMPTSHQSVFVRRDHILNYPFDTRFRWCADQDQLLRLYGDGKSFRSEDVLISIFDCDSDQVRSGNLYIQERWELSKGHASPVERRLLFGKEWIHANVWGPVVSTVRTLLPASWVMRLRELRGTAGTSR